MNMKLHNTSQVDSTSKSTGLLNYCISEIFNIFCLQSQLPGHIHRLVEIIPKMRKKLNTHISTLIKMFAKLITGHMQVMIRWKRC